MNLKEAINQAIKTAEAENNPYAKGCLLSVMAAVLSHRESELLGYLTPHALVEIAHLEADMIARN